MSMDTESISIGLQDIAAGSWHRCGDMGWPLERLGDQAELLIVPLPNREHAALFHRELAARGLVGGNLPLAYDVVNRIIPEVYATTVLTGMRGIRMSSESPILEDTLENRMYALTCSTILVDGVADVAMHGPRGERWRERAIRYQTVVDQIDSLLNSFPADDSVSPEAIVAAMRYRLSLLHEAGVVNLRNLPWVGEVPS